MELSRKSARYQYLNKRILVKNWNIYKDNTAHKYFIILIDKFNLSAIFVKPESKCY